MVHRVVVCKRKQEGRSLGYGLNNSNKELDFAYLAYLWPRKEDRIQGVVGKAFYRKLQGKLIQFFLQNFEFLKYFRKTSNVIVLNHSEVIIHS